jgi:hypothetical protein
VRVLVQEADGKTKRLLHFRYPFSQGRASGDGRKRPGSGSTDSG